METPSPPPPPTSSSSSSSIVSKARTAFHSAAAKAEKVFTDIKADLKNNDRGSDGQQSLKAPPKASGSPGDGSVTNREGHSRWNPTYLIRKHDEKNHIKKVEKEKGGLEEEKTDDTNACSLDEYLHQSDHESIDEMKDSEGAISSVDKEDGPNASCMVVIPPTIIVKQLAMAVENAKNFKSIKDLLTSTRDSSPIKDRAGLSLSAVKSLVLRDKEEKSTFGSGEDEDHLISSLFSEVDHFDERKNDPTLEGLSMSYLPRDIHGAPPKSFVIRLSEIVGSFKTQRKMASFWHHVISELRRMWFAGQPIPRVPLDGSPDLDSCLLYQRLQVINCCIARKRRRNIAIQSLDSVIREVALKEEDSVAAAKLSLNPAIYAKIDAGQHAIRLGADHPSDSLTMLEMGEPIYSPVTQEGPILTEELIRETEEFVLRTGSVGAGCSQLLSDMQAFKAANPGCILEDFIRWHSPPDWREMESDIDTSATFDGNSSSRRGQLSERMQKEGNLWRELWETAKPLPAVKQTPLYDEDLAVEGILNALEDIMPSELFEQLFISILGSGFTTAEAELHQNSDFSKLFYECKDYVIATCQGDLSSDKIEDLCKVYETVETMVVNPEKALTMVKQQESSTMADLRSRFKKISLNFVGKDKPPSGKSASKDPKKSNEKQTHVFSQIFDGKTSLFTKKPPKPNVVQNSATPCLDDSEWTIV
ncbi:hypothetical protein QJS04_geneDACA023445 [Acorus gramineus]|uniref:Rab3GAP catalytic subunit conserved domain-containing protein n=1 Tax=Acorus gramineus TaxID=55184 RepID=A0AAV9A9E8_ACOGR|nr:hypothetical protein QJS04_geneDACA023445 [Acorus gramineus]